MNYEEACEYLKKAPRFSKTWRQVDTRNFLERLGGPDEKLRIIHVAGTNGKGSVCAYMNAILREAGYRVGLFTSPHLVEMRERFVIDDCMVSEEDFRWAFQRVWDSCEGHGQPPFFDYLFLMGMLLFEKSAPDFVILETGLGGRLDATNTVSRKELTVITRIGLDHTEYLGDTLIAIAGEKAGIMRQGVPCVCLESTEEVAQVFTLQAAQKAVPLTLLSKSDEGLLKISNKSIDFSPVTRYYNDVILNLTVSALYQAENATLAIRALEELDRGRTIRKAHLQEGVRRCFWPGRMEEILPGVILDGAHNEDGVRAFLETVAQRDFGRGRILLFSAVGDKDHERMLTQIVESGLFEEICLAPLSTGRAADIMSLEQELSGILADCGKKHPMKSRSAPTVAEALDMLLTNKGDRTLYIAGSLYLVGEVKVYLGVRNDD